MWTVICYQIWLSFLNSTVDCQLGPWTSCNSDCGLAGKTRFFGKWPNRKGVNCSQGDTWQKCGNLKPCAGNYRFMIYLQLKSKSTSPFHFQKWVMPWLLDMIYMMKHLAQKRKWCMPMAPPKFAAQLQTIQKMFIILVVVHL